MAFLFRLNELLCDVALDNFVREVMTQGLATESVDLKALLQGKAARLEAYVHESRAGKVSVSEYRDHRTSIRGARSSAQFADTTQEGLNFASKIFCVSGGLS